MLKFLVTTLVFSFTKSVFANEFNYSYIVDASNQKLTCLVIHYNNINSKGYIYNGFITISNKDKISCEPKENIKGTLIFSSSNLTHEQKGEILNIINEGNIAKQNGFEMIN